MSISIIIPTKNELHNLPRLLKSIFNSKVLPKEVIIVDNHSTDGTLQTAEDILKKYNSKNLKPISYKLYSKGPERSPQKNFGAKKVSAMHLLFLDADMEIPHHLLQELLILSEKKYKAAIIPEKSVGHDFWGRAIALERNCYQNQTLLEAPRFFEKKTFLATGGYDQKLIAGEDWDLAQRLRKKSIKIKKTKNQILHHEPIGLYPNLKRKLYYSQYINAYSQKNPRAFAEQSSLKTRFNIYCKNSHNLIKHPVQTITFLLLKLVVYIRWQLTHND